jgi:hypothetical protein
MAILIKTGPLKPDATIGTVLRLKEKAYRDPVFGAQERAFIWVDGERNGGKSSNLFAEGIVLEEPTFDEPGKSDTLIGVKVLLTRVQPERPLNYSADMRPHKDDPADKLMHSLAEIICKYAHKKITPLTPAQAAFLQSRFEP